MFDRLLRLTLATSLLAISIPSASADETNEWRGCSASFELPLVDSVGEIRILHGDGKASFRDGRLHVTLNQPRRFLFLQF